MVEVCAELSSISSSEREITVNLYTIDGTGEKIIQHNCNLKYLL